eukprot:TRINITY_DN20495_c0_g2_i1.p1 TRINITY_DN20495_c0_g2~~TRINITY_DN20495_c0_g2_i1.p1  ORF type:complete len:341 (-),score=48.48 TRINITY_DN20495_c0_g2_i1:220-1242(-)
MRAKLALLLVVSLALLAMVFVSNIEMLLQTEPGAVSFAAAKNSSWRNSSDGYALMYFVHIHKAGGTSLCDLMWRAKMRIPVQYATWGNCMLTCEEFRHLFMLGKSAEKSKILHSYDFISNEGPALIMHASHVSREIKYFTFLRAPCRRSISHYYQDMPIFLPDPVHPPYLCKSTRCDMERQLCSKAVNASFEDWFMYRTVHGNGVFCNSEPWYSQSLQTLDNFQIRVLCGTHCAGVAFDGIAEDHYLYTLRRIEASGMEVFTLHQLEKKPGVWEELLTYLGHPALSGEKFPQIGRRQGWVMKELRAPKITECSSQIHAWLSWDQKLYDAVWHRWDRKISL